MDRSLVSVRSALVLLLAALAGVAAGLLSVLAGNGMVGGVLTGLGAAGGAVTVFNQVIAPDTVHREPAVRRAGAKGGGVHG
ncbi:hypothetical protein AQI95_05065 [Streptomyces yokosukanensis]|uniref:Uncharacterized protein n=1 Tax=Streptomyces yokosukanensis TaxID=67386 RepID=A0A117Q5F2_9ACTN|nr:hypothetical protein [Streptomyces yokosukanensis]KUN09219.1 hypothetical protein AQI95_05065 [Streptomyces yokosukanensis]